MTNDRIFIMFNELKDKLEKASVKIGIENPVIHLEYPSDANFGDLSSNVAFLYAKKFKISAKSLAEKIVDEFKKDSPLDVDSTYIAQAGFINFKLKDSFFIKEILNIDDLINKGKTDKDQKIMVEYTDPNPFKEFHIGHLMSNTIGESISRILEWSGATIKRANWQGDVGPHVAKALWGAIVLRKKEDVKSGMVFWGKAYALGSSSYDSDEIVKKEIDEINRKIYNQEDNEINDLYKEGREESLKSFEQMYSILGTRFDNYFFEGIEGRNGEAVVKDFLKKGIFEESQGAIIFPGEKYGVYTRVFITSKGLPTYETKEIGLNIGKFEIYPDLSQSIIITGNEQDDYFKTLLKVFSFIREDIASKTKHIGHGMMRLESGKMGSRKGNVITALSLIEDTKKIIFEKMKDRNFSKEEKEKVCEEVAIGAIRYQILRQSIGSDIVYNKERSVSFEGDSGPYLQYACVRAMTVIKKAKEARIVEKISITPEKVTFLERLLIRFPKIVSRACEEYEPHHITTYLTELASVFNSYYGENQIIDLKNPLSPYRVALTKSFVSVMKNGLWLLGINVPERM